MRTTEHFFAPCPRGLEATLARELETLAAERVQAVKGGVEFSGPYPDVLHDQSRKPPREPGALANRSRSLPQRAGHIPNRTWAAVAGLVQPPAYDSRERGCDQEPPEEPRFRDTADQGCRLRRVSGGHQKTTRCRHPQPRRPHPCLPDLERLDTLSRHLGRSAVHARISRRRRRGTDAGEPRRRHPAPQRLGTGNPAARPDVRERHAADRSRHDCRQHRAGSEPQLRLRKAQMP